MMQGKANRLHDNCETSDSRLHIRVFRKLSDLADVLAFSLMQKI